MQNKVGRNELCPCGSGRKYKKCCSNKMSANLGISDNLDVKFKEAQNYFLSGQLNLANAQYKKILSLKPDHSDAMHYLGLSEIQLGNIDEGLKIIQNSISLQPYDSTFQSNYGVLLLEYDQLIKSETYFRKAIELDSKNVQAKYNLCLVLEKTRRYSEAKNILSELIVENSNDFEFLSLYARVLIGLEEWNESSIQYELALKLSPDDISVNMEYCHVLEMLGMDEKIPPVFDRLLEANPSNYELLIHRANYFEANNQLDEADHYLSLAEKNQGANKISLYLCKGRIARRRKNYQLALETFFKIDDSKLNQQLQITFYSEIGKTYDKAEKYDKAFSAFKKCNELKLLVPEKLETIIEANRCDQVNSVLTKNNLKIWSMLSPAPDSTGPEPIFIVGFPRSGSTLFEQIISSHNNIAAGGEFTFIKDIEDEISGVFGIDKKYPEILLNLNNNMDNNYLGKLKEIYIENIKLFSSNLNGKYWITDKRLLNSLELGFIHLLFPESPVLHAVRHPLDVCLSSYFSNFNSHAYTNSLVSTAHKFIQTIEQVNHIKNIVKLNYKIIHYEDVVRNPEKNIRAILDFIGEPWDDSCMKFHENRRIARTASYAQVNQSLYTSSINRYSNYRSQIEEIIPILEPVIYSLGYEI